MVRKVGGWNFIQKIQVFFDYLFPKAICLETTNPSDFALKTEALLIASALWKQLIIIEANE